MTIYEEKMGKTGIIWKIEKEGEWEKLKKKIGEIKLTIYFKETEY